MSQSEVIRTGITQIDIFVDNAYTIMNEINGVTIIGEIFASMYKTIRIRFFLSDGTESSTILTQEILQFSTSGM